jgi:Mitochondrial protein Pet127
MGKVASLPFQPADLKEQMVTWKLAALRALLELQQSPEQHGTTLRAQINALVDSSTKQASKQTETTVGTQDVGLVDFLIRQNYAKPSVKIRRCHVASSGRLFRRVNVSESPTLEQKTQAPSTGEAASKTAEPSIAAVLNSPAPEKRTQVPSTGPPASEKAKSSNAAAKVSKRAGKSMDSSWMTSPQTSNIKFTPVSVKQPSVPKLSYGLDRVLFNPGVYRLQDSRTRVYNFDPYLEEIMPASEFDFDALAKYVTSSEDLKLLAIAKNTSKRYTGSTSSLTNLLSQFHFLLSAWREPNMSMLSLKFPNPLRSFTQLSRGPAGTFLRYRDGVYAIDADKEFSTSNILSMLGRSMEKMLTLDTNRFERYRKSNSSSSTDATKDESDPESFHFTTIGDFVLRSQLDAHDPRLPGSGMFDLKTRAVVSVRMNVDQYEKLRDYEIVNSLGEWESFEREYHDMIRAAFLKYSLQVRMGRMDGIFVAYHNTQRIFGFQYIPLSEMDYTLHGQTEPELGDGEFKLSMHLLNVLINKATEKFPQRVWTSTA